MLQGGATYKEGRAYLALSSSIVPHHACNDYENANGKDKDKHSSLPPMNLQLVQHFHRKNICNCILEYIEPSICEAEGIDIDVRSLNVRVPSFANWSALEDTGAYRSDGSSGHDSYAYPDEPSKTLLHSDTEVKVRNRHLRYRYTKIKDGLAGVQLPSTSVKYMSCSRIECVFTSSDALKLLSCGKS